MRHRKRTLKLSRTSAHRKALLANLVSSFIREERIITTLAKARATAVLADRMVTLAKAGTLAARRHALQALRDKEAVKKLFSEIGGRFTSRSGGYTRLLKMASPRRGDNAPRAVLLFTEEGSEAKPSLAKAKKESKKESKQESSPVEEKGKEKGK